jgi:SAM-dependent methyltransferase
MCSLPNSPSKATPIGSSNDVTRHAWVQGKLAGLISGGRLLDAGAGTQRYRSWCSHLTYVAHDFGAYDGKGDGAGLQTGEFDYGNLDIISDICAIPAPDNSFDAILCTEVLEHVPHPEAALRELVRLLKPGGNLILTAPFISFTHFAPYHFCTGFSRYFYEHHLSINGVDIIEITPNGGFFDVVAQEVLRTKTMAEHYTGSRLRLWERLAQRVFLRGLVRLHKNDQKSWEFACFGFHVHARKRAALR